MSDARRTELMEYSTGTEGLHGFEVINDTTLHTGNYIRLIVIVDSVFTTLTGNSTVTIPQTFKAGEDLAGKWSAFQISSGELRAYKGA